MTPDPFGWRSNLQRTDAACTESPPGAHPRTRKSCAGHRWASFEKKRKNQRWTHTNARARTHTHIQHLRQTGNDSKQRDALDLVRHVCTRTATRNVHDTHQAQNTNSSGNNNNTQHACALKVLGPFRSTRAHMK